jgi:hypothetical protein
VTIIPEWAAPTVSEYVLTIYMGDLSKTEGAERQKNVTL